MGNIERIAIARRKGQLQPSPELLAALAAPTSPPALISDQNDRIVFWNRAAAELLGRPSAEAVGRRCFDVLGGDDVYGNRFCYENCPVKNAVGNSQPVSGFVLDVECGDAGRRTTHATILPLPGPEPGEFMIVHILDRIPSAAAARPAPWPATFTPREREVLQSIAAGLQNKEVAQHLGISPATVRNHVHNILEKLAVHSKLEAVSIAFRSGWVAGLTCAAPARKLLSGAGSGTGASRVASRPVGQGDSDEDV